MGYRKLELPEHDDRQHRRMTATGSPGPKITLNADAITEIAFPCFYVDEAEVSRAYPHDRDHHDHMGWPNAGKPDKSCQAFLGSPKPGGWCWPEKYLDPDKLIPIDLLEEGYESYYMYIDRKWLADISLSIDPTADYAIRYAVYPYIVEGYVNDDQPWVIRFEIDTREIYNIAASFAEQSKASSSIEDEINSIIAYVESYAQKREFPYTVFADRTIFNPSRAAAMTERKALFTGIMEMMPTVQSQELL